MPIRYLARASVPYFFVTCVALTGCSEAEPPVSQDTDGGFASFDGSFIAADGATVFPDSSTPVPGSDGSVPPDGSLSGEAGTDAGPGTEPNGKCSARLPAISDDPGVRGPWKVGVRTVKIDRLTVEVMYPAKPGSEAGATPATYDVRDFLPEKERSKVPDAHSPAVTAVGGDVFRDLPIDERYGPYPVVIFIHGTSSFRVASGSTNAHWASRGFVVLAADYPGLGLSDYLSGTIECLYPQSGVQDVPKDVNSQLAALKSAAGELAFLKDRIDLNQLGLSGHSQGGCITATLTNLPGLRVVVPMSSSAAIADTESIESAMFITGMADRVMPWDLPFLGDVVCPLGSTAPKVAYDLSPKPPQLKKRIVGIRDGGHLVVTDLCQKNQVGKNAIEEAQADGVCGIATAVAIGLPYLFDCGGKAVEDYTLGVKTTNFVSTAALEEVLHCKDRSKAFSELKAKNPLVEVFLEEVK